MKVKIDEVKFLPSEDPAKLAMHVWASPYIEGEPGQGVMEIKDAVSIDEVLVQIQLTAAQTTSRLGRLARLEKWLEMQR